VGKKIKEIVSHPGEVLTSLPNPLNTAGPLSGVTNKFTGGLQSPFGQGGVLTNLIAGGQKGPNAPGVDPALIALKQKQVANANAFRKNLPNMQGQMTSQLEEQAQGQLHDTVGTIRQNASNRGLLYGGLRAGSEGKARAGIAKNLAAGKMDINSMTNTAADQMDLDAIQSGINIQKSQQEIQNNVYAQALAKMQGQGAILGSIFSAGGSILGGKMGAK
jgi:hypothetical protein